MQYINVQQLTCRLVAHVNQL